MRERLLRTKVLTRKRATIDSRRVEDPNPAMLKFLQLSPTEAGEQVMRRLADWLNGSLLHVGHRLAREIESESARKVENRLAQVGRAAAAHVLAFCGRLAMQRNILQVQTGLAVEQ